MIGVSNWAWLPVCVCKPNWGFAFLAQASQARLGEISRDADTRTYHAGEGIRVERQTFSLRRECLA